MGNSRLHQVENYQSGGNRIKWRERVSREFPLGPRIQLCLMLALPKYKNQQILLLAYALQGCALVGYEGMPSAE